MSSLTHAQQTDVKMNLQQPTNMQPAVAEAEDVAASQRISTTIEGSARRDVAAAGRNASPPSNQALAAAASNMPHDILQGLNPTMKLKEATCTVSGIRKPSPPPSKDALSSPMESSTGSGSASGSGGSSNFSLPPSIISKVSSLSTKRDEINNAEAACVSADGNDSTSSISTSNEIGNNDGSLVPDYITTTTFTRSTETIFKPRKKELHFFSHVFRQDYESWLNYDNEDEGSDDDDDDDSVDDDDDDDDDMQDEITAGYTEYNGRTSFVPRNNSYRKSHEMGALWFAETLLADLHDGDTDTDDETLIGIQTSQ